MVLARRQQQRARELRQDPWSAGAGSAPLSASEYEEMRAHLWGHQAKLRSRQQAPPSRGPGAAATVAAPSEAAAAAEAAAEAVAAAAEAAAEAEAAEAAAAEAEAAAAAVPATTMRCRSWNASHR